MRGIFLFPSRLTIAVNAFTSCFSPDVPEELILMSNEAWETLRIYRKQQRTDNSFFIRDGSRRKIKNELNICNGKSSQKKRTSRKYIHELKVLKSLC